MQPNHEFPELKNPDFWTVVRLLNRRGVYKEINNYKIANPNFGSQKRIAVYGSLEIGGLFFCPRDLL